MFDCLITPKDLQNSHVHHAIQHLALFSLLVDKGIATWDECEVYIAKATQVIDQAVAAKIEEAEKEFDVEHPGVRDTWEKLFGCIGNDMK